MKSSTPSSTEQLARSLVRGLSLELTLTPKPGLVDLLDSGSHADLSLPLMTSSIGLMGEYFAAIAAALGRGASLPEMVTLGRRTEEKMLQSFGANTHKGAIFLGGLLLTGRARIDSDDPLSLRRAVAAAAGEFFALCRPEGTHGERVREGYRVGGIVSEALAGFPSLFCVALPAWHEGIARSGDKVVAARLMMGRLMQTVEDTTALHRCGRAGLERLRRDGRCLEETIAAGEDPFSLLRDLNDEYRRMNLTMGGVADMLGLAFGYLDFRGFLNRNGYTVRMDRTLSGVKQRLASPAKGEGIKRWKRMGGGRRDFCVSSCFR